MTPEELDAIEARANAATPGPWAGGVPPVGDDTTLEQQVLDSEFVRHAREDVPALVAGVRRLHEALAVEREACAQIADEVVIEFSKRRWEPDGGVCWNCLDSAEIVGDKIRARGVS